MGREFFDDSVYLMEHGANYELEVIKESPASETAYGEMIATDSKEGLSKDNLPQTKPVVKFSSKKIRHLA